MASFSRLNIKLVQYLRLYVATVKIKSSEFVPLVPLSHAESQPAQPIPHHFKYSNLGIYN